MDFFVGPPPSSPETHNTNPSIKIAGSQQQRSGSPLKKLGSPQQRAPAANANSGFPSFVCGDTAWEQKNDWRDVHERSSTSSEVSSVDGFDDVDDIILYQGKNISDLNDAEIATFLKSGELANMRRLDRRRVVEILQEREFISGTRAKSLEIVREEERRLNKDKISEISRNDEDKVKACVLDNAWPVPAITKLEYSMRHSICKWKKFFTKIFTKIGSDDKSRLSRWPRSPCASACKSSLQLRYTLRIIPFVNLMYDLFFDSSPIGCDSVRSLLDIVGLLNALLLGVALSVLASVNYDDAIKTDERYGFGQDGIYWPGDAPASDTQPTLVRAWASWGWYLPPSCLFLEYITNSVSLFFIGVICVVYLYADMVSKMPDDEAEKSEPPGDMTARNDKADFELSPPTSSDMFQRWWIYSKFGVLAVMFTTMLGCIYSVFAILVLCFIKFPDYWILQTGKFSGTDYLDPFGYMDSFFKLAAAIAGFVVIMSCGMGTSRRYSFEDDMHECFALKMLLKSRKAEWELSNYDDAQLRGQYITALTQSFFFFMACEDFRGAKAVLNSLKTSGLLGDKKVCAFIMGIADSGDVYYGITENVPEDIEETVTKRIDETYYNKLRFS